MWVRGLELLCYGNGLRELRVFNMEKRLWGNLRAPSSTERGSQELERNCWQGHGRGGIALNCQKAELH